MEFIDDLNEILSVQQEKSVVQKSSYTWQTPVVQKQCSYALNINA